MHERHPFVHLPPPKTGESPTAPPGVHLAVPRTRRPVARHGGRSPRRPPAQLRSATTSGERWKAPAGLVMHGTRPRCWPSTSCPAPTPNCGGSGSRSMTPQRPPARTAARVDAPGPQPAPRHAPRPAHARPHRQDRRPRPVPRHRPHHRPPRPRPAPPPRHYPRPRPPTMTVPPVPRRRPDLVPRGFPTVVPNPQTQRAHPCRCPCGAPAGRPPSVTR
jgi:myosin tail region-interacting protein MTI1